MAASTTNYERLRKELDSEWVKSVRTIERLAAKWNGGKEKA